jgi:hypothetical protein
MFTLGYLIQHLGKTNKAKSWATTFKLCIIRRHLGVFSKRSPFPSNHKLLSVIQSKLGLPKATHSVLQFCLFYIASCSVLNRWTHVQPWYMPGAVSRILK